MSISIVFTLLFLLTTVVCQSPQYNSLREFLQSQKLATTTASLVTSVRNESLLTEVTELFKSVAAVIIAVTGLMSIIGPCWCIVRCIKNGGKIKKQWFYPKSLSEYRRRHEIEQSRIMAIDRLAALPANLDSSA